MFKHAQYSLFLLVMFFLFSPVSYSRDLVSDFTKEEPLGGQTAKIVNIDPLFQFARAYTTRIFSKNATPEDQQKILVLLEKEPASEALLSFLLCTFNGNPAPDPVFIRLQKLAEANPHAGLLNLIVGDTLLSKKGKETPAECEARLKLASDFLRNAYRKLVTNAPKEKKSDHIPSKIVTAAAKYMVVCLARKDDKTLDSVMHDLRVNPQFYDSPEILSVMLMISTTRLELRTPVLPVPFGPVPDDSFRQKALLDSDIEHFLRLLGEGKMKNVRQTGKTVALLVKQGYAMELQNALLSWSLITLGADREPLRYLFTVKEQSRKFMSFGRICELYLERTPSPEPRLVFAVADVYRLSGVPERALSLLNRYQAKIADKCALAEKYVQVYTQMGKLLPALSMTNGLKEGFFKYVQRTLILMELERWNEASVAADKMIFYVKKDKKIQQDKKSFYLLQAEIEEKLGNIQKVKSILEPLILESPGNSHILNFLGYVLADHNMELEYAQKLIERALDADPQNYAILDSMAWVLYRRGKLKEAERYILDSLSRATGQQDGTVFDHAGDIFLARGAREKAIRYWKLALEQLGESHSDRMIRENIRKKLSAHGEK